MKGWVQCGDSAAGGEEEVCVMWLQGGEGYLKCVWDHLDISKEAKASIRRCLVEFMRAVLRARSKKSFLREQDSAGATNQIENWSSLAVMTTFASSRSIVFSANILLSGSLRNHDRMSYRRLF